MNNLRRSTKLLLGVATIWPLVYMFLFMAFVFSMIFIAGPLDPNRLFGTLFGAGFIVVFVAHILTMFLILGLTVFYIVHAIKNDAVKSDMKVIWIVLFFFAGMIVEPVYWYMHVWKAREVETAAAVLSAGSTSTWDFESARARPGEYQTPSEPPDWR